MYCAKVRTDFHWFAHVIQNPYDFLFCADQKKIGYLKKMLVTKEFQFPLTSIEQKTMEVNGNRTSLVT